MYIFVDVGMFYKSAHNFLYKAWGAWNAKIGLKCQQWRILYLVGGSVL